MNISNNKPTILWVLQDNQLSPIIVDFLKLLQKGVGKINVRFIMPVDDTDALKMAEPLAPDTFKAGRNISPRSFENFCRKRDQIHDVDFPDGLKVWQTLVLDDLGEGLLVETTLELPSIQDVRGIVLQIPVPLGSATKEEMIFNAWVRTAKTNHVPIVGYELLPLYTRWTLIPSMLDGIITTNELSFDYLSRPESRIRGKIWKLPRHEGKVFSPGTSILWRNGMQSPYHYRHQYQIPKDKTIVFVAHNVAMGYEYKKLLEEISMYGSQIHLMFSIGKDQIRGTHNHEEIIRTLSSNTLPLFHSISFHDLNAPWEMVMADVVLACACSYSTIVAEANGIPCIVMDNEVPEAKEGHIQIINTCEQLRKLLERVIKTRAKTTDITNILYEMANNSLPVIDI